MDKIKEWEYHYVYIGQTRIENIRQYKDSVNMVVLFKLEISYLRTWQNTGVLEEVWERAIRTLPNFRFLGWDRKTYRTHVGFAVEIPMRIVGDRTTDLKDLLLRKLRLDVLHRMTNTKPIESSHLLEPPPTRKENTGILSTRR